jgi:hypothetical protein
MTLMQRQRRERDRAIRRALREFGDVRAAAASLGMPKSTFFEACARLRIVHARRTRNRVLHGR